MFSFYLLIDIVLYIVFDIVLDIVFDIVYYAVLVYWVGFIIPLCINKALIFKRMMTCAWGRNFLHWWQRGLLI
ncbi:hypothetical protein PPACK8108_LOCUS8029 [Phakopsora pachyrhizi]|uniref:Uncharacterized protein n=1 Tax=Phakopsora pachyrhizi TaxID=170000 RepID=A0AAV0AYF9_PHAPC|nr:hypothetical protein PPACK8108_LOCUS8029 [Phakopsora pachyrhizi]